MKENPFADKLSEFGEKPEVDTRPSTLYTAGETHCIKCGKELFYNGRELKHGTVRLYCSKECRKNKRIKQ